MTTFQQKSNKGSKIARNSAARLLAVQAVYQMIENDQTDKEVIAEFIKHRTGHDVDGDEFVQPEVELFSRVVTGVSDNREQLVSLVINNRGEKARDSVAKTEKLLQAIFLCGSFELMAHQSIDFPIIISDYLHVTHAFYEEPEAKLVNALLDSVRKVTRE